MRTEGLYMFPAYVTIMELARKMKKGCINVATAASGTLSYDYWLKWYKDVFTDIHIHKDGRVVYMDAESLDPELNTKNEQLLQTQISDGYWIYVHDSFDGMIFKQFDTYKQALRAYKKIKVTGVFHPEQEALYKYLFFYKENDCDGCEFGLKKYRIESKISKWLLPKYYKYIRNPIVTPLRNWWHR